MGHHQRHFRAHACRDKLHPQGFDLAFQSRDELVALIGDEATLKRFYPEGDRVRLQPSNPAMKPIYVPSAELRIQGVVVGLMRKY